MAYLPCLNPNCKSQGRAHPNCHCYDDISSQTREGYESRGWTLPGQTAGMVRTGVRGGNYAEAKKRGRSYKYSEGPSSAHRMAPAEYDKKPKGGGYFAEGGEVGGCPIHIPHKRGCIHFLDGGPVPPAIFGDDGIDSQLPPTPVIPAVTLGHAAVAHGLLGLMKNVGHAKMVEPEKHHKTMEKIKGHLAENDHRKAAGMLHGHPLAGSVSKDNLNHIMNRLGPALTAVDHNPPALRSSIDYLNSAIKGHDSLGNHMKNLLGREKLSVDHDEKSVEQLKAHLENLQENPEKILETGGQLGHYLPDHAAGLGALTSTAVEYLNDLKPKTPQMAPMDDPTPPDKYEMAAYERHLSIAQQPLMILRHVKDGTLIPKDITTLQILYPALYKSMAEKAGEALIEAKTKEREIPYFQKQSLAMLIDQPLDSTMTPMSMQAIIKSAGTQQAQVQQQKQKKATGAQLKAIEKTDAMYETPLESRQMDNKS